MSRTLLSPPGVLSLVAVVLAAAGVGYAAIPSADGTIHGCYSKTDGTLRVVDGDGVGRRCPDTATALTWNQKGPAGPAGPKGTVGPQGPAGSAGGFKGIRAVKVFGPFSDATSKKVTANCAASEVATGGGHQLVGSVTGRVITRSFPIGGNPPTGWQVKARVPAPSGNWRVRAWAICAAL